MPQCFLVFVGFFKDHVFLIDRYEPISWFFL